MGGNDATSEPQFFQTRMGRTYYEHTMPEITKQLTRLNDLLQRLIEQLERDGDRDADA